MDDLRRAPTTDPTSLYGSRDSLYASDILFAAVNGVDFFTWLSEHPGTIEDICGQFGFHRRPVDVVTTLFTAMGLLERVGPALRVSAVAREYLVAASPWFMGPYFPKIEDQPIAQDMLEILRTGKPVDFFGRKGKGDWHRAMETEAFAEEFTATMDCRGLLLAQALAKRIDLAGGRRLLDIAGGSGVYACSFAAQFPDLRASVFEKPPVDRIAARAIGTRGYSDRVVVIAGDMLVDALPSGHDVHLFSNVLHDWDEDVVQQLLRASAAVLPSGGTLIVHDCYLNDDKTGPLAAAGYSTLLMHVSQGRCYSRAEMTSWLGEAGFATTDEVPSAVGRSALIAKKS